MTPASPTLEVEAALLAHAPFILAVDEVGRGALAGPVAVGVAVVGPEEVAAGAPEGLRDSKLLTPRMRERLAPASAAWVRASAVGWADADEIDRFGIGACLAAAAVRALGELWHAGVPIDVGQVLLDGSHDWLTPGLTTPFRIPLVVRPKADRDCASVAAASVIAKVTRDARMAELDAAHEGRYGWDANKGYGSAAHRAAIVEHGPCPEHRASWLTKILAGAATTDVA